MKRLRLVALAAGLREPLRAQRAVDGRGGEQELRDALVRGEHGLPCLRRTEESDHP